MAVSVVSRIRAAQSALSRLVKLTDINATVTQGSERIDSVLGEEVIDVFWAQRVLAGCNTIDKDTPHLLARRYLIFVVTGAGAVDATSCRPVTYKAQHGEDDGTNGYDHFDRVLIRQSLDMDIAVTVEIV